MFDTLFASIIKILVTPLIWALTISGFGVQQFGAVQAVGGEPYTLSGSGITSSATTLGLTSFTIPGGDTKLTMTDFGTLGCGTIEPGNKNKQEFVSFSGVVQNSDGTATLTGLVRGLAPISPYTSSTTLQHAHSGGSSFVISNSPPCFYEGYGNLGENEAVTGQWSFNTVLPSSSLIATTSAQFVTKSLLDATSFQGVATSTELAGGIVELATASEQASSYNGGASKPTVLQTRYSTSTPGSPQSINSNYNITADTAGYLKQGWINLTEAFTFTGGLTSSATTTISGSSLTNGAVVVNSLAYKAPSVRGASSTVPMEDGSGNITWNRQEWALLVATTTTASMATTTVTVPASSELRVVFQTNGTVANTYYLTFNSDTGGNYGWVQMINGTATGLSSQKGSVIGNSGGGSSTITMEIQNVSSLPKTFTSRQIQYSSATITEFFAVTGVWNNSSSQITSIQIGNAGAIPTGSRIKVYGTNN